MIEQDEMEKKRKKVRVVFHDDGKDKSVLGCIIGEDENFLFVETDFDNHEWKIAKNRIVIIKEVVS